MQILGNDDYGQASSSDRCAEGLNQKFRHHQAVVAQPRGVPSQGGGASAATIVPQEGRSLLHGSRRRIGSYYLVRKSREDLGHRQPQQVAELPQAGRRYPRSALLVSLNGGVRHVQPSGHPVSRQTSSVALEPQPLPKRAVDMQGLAAVAGFFVRHGRGGL